MNRKRIVFAVVAAVLVAAAAPYVRPAIERGWFVYTLWTEPPPAHLPSPIARVSAHAMTNSFGSARSGGRRHEGIDIFAPKETPVLSTTRGVVTRLDAHFRIVDGRLQRAGAGARAGLAAKIDAHAI